MTVQPHVRLLRVVTMKACFHPFLLGLSGVVLLTGTARPSEFDDAVRLAIDRGVAALKQSIAAGRNRQYGVGSSALVALTLLECGVPVDDETVARAVTQVREA